MDLTTTLGLLGFLGACFVAASTGAIFKPGPWYDTLAKPSWRPPNWLFPPAWAVLYILMAVAAWLVWREAGFAGAPLALMLWFRQLALNAAWSWIFFGLKRMDRPSPSSGAVAGDPGDDPGLRPAQHHCGLADGALPRLGQLRRLPQPDDVAAEPGTVAA